MKKSIGLVIFVLLFSIPWTNALGIEMSDFDIFKTKNDLPEFLITAKHTPFIAGEEAYFNLVIECLEPTEEFRVGDLLDVAIVTRRNGAKVHIREGYIVFVEERRVTEIFSIDIPPGRVNGTEIEITVSIKPYFEREYQDHTLTYIIGAEEISMNVTRFSIPGNVTRFSIPGNLDGVKTKIENNSQVQKLTEQPYYSERLIIGAFLAGGGLLILKRSFIRGLVLVLIGGGVIFA